MVSLADRQAEFARAVIDDTLWLPGGLVVPSGVQAADRFSVYRNNVAVGLVEALRSTYPVVDRLVGQAFFQAMALAYARQALPPSPVLLAYGEGFPDYVSCFPALVDFPYIGDVARLEWAWVAAYHAAYAQPVAIESLRTFSADAMPGLRLVLHPSVSVHAFDHPALSIWWMHQDHGDACLVDVENRREAVLVWRDGVDVRMVDIGAGAVCFLKTLQDGRSLGAAGQAALEADPELLLPELIQQLFGLGVFIAALEVPAAARLLESAT